MTSMGESRREVDTRMQLAEGSKQNFTGNNAAADADVPADPPSRYSTRPATRRKTTIIRKDRLMARHRVGSVRLYATRACQRGLLPRPARALLGEAQRAEPHRRASAPACCATGTATATNLLVSDGTATARWSTSGTPPSPGPIRPRQDRRCPSMPPAPASRERGPRFPPVTSRITESSMSSAASARADAAAAATVEQTGAAVDRRARPPCSSRELQYAASADALDREDEQVDQDPDLRVGARVEDASGAAGSPVPWIQAHGPLEGCPARRRDAGDQPSLQNDDILVLAV